MLNQNTINCYLIYAIIFLIFTLTVLYGLFLSEGKLVKVTELVPVPLFFLFKCVIIDINQFSTLLKRTNISFYYFPLLFLYKIMLTK